MYGYCSSVGVLHHLNDFPDFKIPLAVLDNYLRVFRGYKRIADPRLSTFEPSSPLSFYAAVKLQQSHLGTERFERGWV